jgi:fumarate reductase flavoprotein subunit
MMTALRAARNPSLSVGIFEKNSKLGCNTQISSGSLAAGGTRFQRAAGVVDSPERHAEDILAVSKDEASAPLLLEICRAAPRYVEWLADELDYPVELGLDMPRSGQSVPRLHTDTGRRGGRVLVSALRSAVHRTASVAFVDNSPAVRLLGSADGVMGIEVASSNQRTTTVYARAVVLAADGFAADAAMLARYCPDAVTAFYGGASTSTGEVMRWAIGIGARTRNMAAFLGHGLVVAGHGTRLNPSLPFLGAVLLDSSGHRFVDERGQGYSKLAAILRSLPDRRAAIIWTPQAHEAAMHSELMRESAAAGAFTCYASIDALAAGLKLPPAALRSSLTDHEGHVMTAPLYGTWVTYGILTTQGGLEVDMTGRVRRQDGAAVPGLHAVGGTAAGVSGPSPEGYSSGNGLLAAMGLGWIAGNYLAAA